jgi:trehalose/maltose hydrolase-like predicted phosphorylase
MGVMAGTLDLMQRAYPGTEIRDEVLRFEPTLPGPIEELLFTMQFRRTPLQVTLNKDRLTLAVYPEGASGPIRVGAGGEIRELCLGDRYMFVLSRAMSAEERRVDG